MNFAGSYPLAVFSSSVGLVSESFIHRHMEELLPGAAVAVVRRRGSGCYQSGIPFPCLVLEESKLNRRWIWRGTLYFLGLHKVGPTTRMVRDYLLDNGVEVILSEYLHLTLAWLDLARELGIRIYAHAHGYDVSRILRNPVMQTRYLQLNRADGIITMSELTRRRLEDIGLDRGRIHVVPYGVDVPDAPPSHVETDVIRCLAVGRMVGKKAPLLTLEAFRQALFSVPAMRLDFVGDGELFDQVDNYVRENALGDSVVLHGSLGNGAVLEMMAASDIFLQHSRIDPETGDEEGMPVAILEAMARGLPVVSTRHAGIPEAVREEATGLLVDEGDTDAMAAAIVRLARDRGLRGRFGEAGWALARDRFSWQRERSDLVRLLRLREPQGRMSP